MYLVTGLDGVEKLVLICLYYRHTHNEISQRQYTFRDKDFLGGKKSKNEQSGRGGDDYSGLESKLLLKRQHWL